MKKAKEYLKSDYLSKYKNRIISVFLCICMLFCICACRQNETLPAEKSNISAHTGTNAEETSQDTNDYSEHSFAIHYIDVGQGDAALAVCDDKTMLIDGGKPHAGSIIYTYLKKLNIDYLDYIVVSHADDDHIGGLSAPLAKMKVGNVLAPVTEADTRSYTNLKTKTAEQGLTIIHPKPGEIRKQRRFWNR